MVQGRPFSGGVMLLVVATLTASCSPIVFPDRPAAGRPSAPALSHPVSLAQALDYGLRVREAYRRRISRGIMLENATGGGLIAIAAASFGLAATGDHPGALAGLGAGGAAGYIATRTYASRQQQLVYAAGAGAVICSLQTAVPMEIAQANLPELKRQVEGPPGIGALRDEVQEILDNNRGAETDEVNEARAAIANADAAYSRGLETIVVLESAGEKLLLAIRGIEGQVDHALIESRPDLDTLYASLATAIPTAAAPIMAAAPLETGQPVPTRAAFNRTTEQERLASRTEDLVREARHINLLADKVAAIVVQQPAQDCGADIATTASALVLDQTGQLAVDVGGRAQQVTINASGGVPPYLARWSGLTPAAGIRLRMGDRYDGTVLVDLDGNAPAGSYVVAVSDGARGRAALTLVVSNAAVPVPAVAPTAVMAAPDLTAGQSDPVVLDVQRSLVATGITAATVNGVRRPLVADGRWGAVTREAIRAYLRGIPNGIVTTSNDRAELIRLVKERGL